MKKISIIILLFCIALAAKTYSQGCVAIRSTGGICSKMQATQDTSSGWYLNANNRYFTSFRHFIGTTEQKQRIQQGTNVINHQYTLDLSLTRVLNPRWSILLDMPIESN
jgi:hypothetical protein